jgi:VCBS repeat-containing protein
MHRFFPGNLGVYLFEALAKAKAFRSRLILFLLVLVSGAAQASTLVQEFYLPMPEAQVYQAESTIQTGISTTQNSIYSIVVTGNGTQIYYDQWEDGYEINLNSPSQATTQIWGDGNDANGKPPGFATDPLGLPAGTVIMLTNNVPLPRNPSIQLFDARDRIAATKALVITRAGWPVTPGPVFGGAVSVLSTIDYGTNYLSPVGQDITNKLFQYVGLFVMAAQNGTTVTIDPDGPGPIAATNIVLNRGESYLVNGGIKKGASVLANKPVQAHLMIGHIAGSYAADWFTLFPVEQWSDTYFTPVGSAASGVQPTYVYLFNANPTSITVNYNTLSGSGSFSIPATNGIFQFQMPKGSGASFSSSGGAKFYALCTVAANNSSDTAYNWGFALLPRDGLTTEADAGWAPGSSDGSVNGSPVWITPVTATRIYVDYKGDRNGPLTDSMGNKYDTNFDLVALQSKTIYDPSRDQTGMRVYTLDGTLISAAWGEDPDVAAPGNPYIDAGTVVLPFPVPTLTKTSTIVTDAPPAGLSLNDVIEYTFTLNNKGLLPLGNTVVFDQPSTNLVYVTNSTTLDGNPVPDNPIGTAFPLDVPGYTIPVILRGGMSTFKYRERVNAAGLVTNGVSVAGTSLSAQTMITAGTNTCILNFSDAVGTTVAAYAAGSNIFVTLTDGGANTSVSTTQTVTVAVKDTSNGDYETITLIETGANTGVFRNQTRLPTSLSTGVGQQDGTLNVAAGDSLTVSSSNPIYGNSCNAAAAVLRPALTKVLYFSGTNAPDQTLDRIDPAATPMDNTTAQTVVLGSTSSSGSVTLVGTNTATSASTTSLTMPTIAVANVTNRLLLVSVTFNPTGANGVSGVTYSGQALSLVQSWRDGANSANNVRCEIWSLLNPPVGSSNVVINFAGGGANALTAGATIWSGVDQATPFSRTNTADGNGASVSLSIVSATNELVFNAVGIKSGASASTTGTGQVKLWGFAQNPYGTASVAPGAASVTNSWIVPSGQQWSSIAVSIKAAAVSGVGGTNVTSFLQAPSFALPFIMPAGGIIAVTNFASVISGSLPSNPAITATLQASGTNIITLSNATYTAASAILAWSGVLGSSVTVPVGQAITCVFSNAQVGVTFTIDYDSVAKRSKIELPASTVITISSLGIYDGPYPGGNLVTTPVAGSTLYVRAVSDDPFGSYDITSLNLAITAPNTNANLNVTLNSSSVVATNAASKTYEYVWQTGAYTGGYNLAATANEGTEGINAIAATSVSLIFLDLGTPSTSEFTSGNNGVATNSFAANGSVCIRVTDLDQNANASLIETLSAIVSSSSGDSELVTLAETGTNTGIFTACLSTSTNSGAGGNNGLLLAPVGSVLTINYTDPNDSSDQSSASGTIQPPPGVPGIAVNKSIISPANGQAVVGDTVQFSLQVINTGSTSLTNVALTDNFPATRLAFQSASLAPTSTNASSVTWTNFGAFAPGQSTNITVFFTATTSGAAPNSASVNSGATAGNGSATITNTQPALAVTKTLLSPTNTPVSISSNAVFRIVIKNTGNTSIPTLPMEDTFSSAYLQFVSATIPPNGSGAGSLIWTNLANPTPLAVNASITNDVTMLVVGAGNPALNSATVDFAVDGNGKDVPATTGTSTNLVTASAKISGSIYNDLDQSGTLTVNDVGLGGVTLQLFTDPNGDGNPADGALAQMTTTDSSGAYEFLNLPIGHYVVVETDLPGYVSSAPANNRIALNIVSLTATINNNFFDYQPSPAVYGNVLGTVWYDANGNGTNDVGETGITNGVTIDLVQDVNTNGLADLGEPVVASAATDSSGNYTFANVTPGEYVVRESDLFGYYSTGDSRAPNDNQVAVAITNGLTVTNISFYDRLLPTAVSDTTTAPNNLPVIISPLGNDLSPNGDGLIITNVVTTNGIVVINSGSTNITFTPTNLAVATILYTISDGHGGSSTAAITVTVTNQPPVAVNDTVTTPVNVPLTISPLNNDSDPNGDALIIISVNPTNGAASIVNGTNVLFTPAANFTGAATIGYTISDGNGGTAGAVITVNVTAAADLAVSKSGPANVFAGASFNYTITVTNLGASTAGSLSVTDSLPATVAFVSATPIATLNGSQVVWTNLGSLAANASTNLTVTVTPSNSGGSLTNVAVAASSTPDPNPTNNTSPPVVTTVIPVADVAVGKSGPVGQVPPGANFSYTISVTNFGPSTASSLSVTDGLPANLTFFNASPSATVSGSVVTWANLGNLAAGAITNLTLTVTAPLKGSATNVASAGSTTFDTNTVNNTTPPVTTLVSNLPPVAVDDTASTAKNVAVTVPVLSNDSDPNGDLLTLISVITTNGTASVSGTNVIYTPALNFSGTAVLSYTITDGQGGTNSAFITVTVGDTAPVANNDAYTTAEDTVLNVPVGGVLTNDVDADNDALTASLVTTTTHGALVLNANGSFSYTPATNYNGPDNFTYRANDGTANSGIATVSLTVSSVNDAPAALNQSVTTPEDTATNLVLSATDVDSTNLVFAILAGPTNGTLSLLSTNTGSVTYTPATNFNGGDSFTFTAFDGSLYATGLVTITVTPVNDAPVANNQAVTTAEDTAKSITLTATDVDGNALTYAIGAGPTNGTISSFNAATGALTYTPGTNYNGVDHFTFVANDGTVNSAAALITITVIPVNDAPVANNQSVTTAEDTARSITLTATDVDGDPLIYAIAAGPTNGTISGFNAATGVLTYTPGTNYNGVDHFTFVANDGTVNSAAALVTITVTPVNDAPTANGQSVTTAEDTAKAITLTGSDVDGDALTYLIVAGPTNGVISGLNATNGVLTYTPSTNYNGSDHFTFVANDGTVNSAAALVTITVTPVNDAPVANNQSVTTAEDTAKSITLTATDVDGDTLTYSIVSGPTNGTISSFNPTNGALTYLPGTNYNGVDHFTFIANDGTVNSAAALITITVTPVNDAPVANNQSVSTAEDTAKTITLTATDVDGDALIYAVVTGPTNGTISGFSAATGALTYTPSTNYNGVDHFTFVANDGTVNSTAALVSITVTSVNHAPTANSQSVTTAEDTAKIITLTASDIDGDTLTYSIITGPTNGVISGLNATNGVLTYTPSPNYNGVDHFTFVANDGTVNSAAALVTITVSPVNDAPVAVNQTVSIPEDTTTNLVLTATDVDSANLFFAILAGPTNGTLSVLNTNSGAVTYIPATNYNGSDTLTFTVFDGSLYSTGSVTITVTPVNDAPVANNQSVTTAEDTAKSITLTATDVDGDTLTYSIVSGPTNGTISGFNATNGALTYLPSTNYNGADHFTFVANDGTVNSAAALVTITVTPVNDAPVAQNQSVTTPEDTAKAITLTASDVDGDSLTYSIMAAPTNGTISGFNASAGTLTYRPSTNYNGVDHFTFVANDGTVNSAAALVTITVTPVNDAPVANGQSVATPEDTAKGITLTASDVDGSPLTYSIVTGPTNGAISSFNASAGTLTYTPSTNYNGVDHFTFVANDGTGNSTAALVTITVTPVNDAPVANNQSVTTPEDIAKVITLTASDVDGDTLTYSIVANPTNGTISGFNAVTGSLTYRPNTNFNGVDHFTFVANDGTVNSSAALLTITVTPVNDAPGAANDAYGLNKNTTLSVAAAGILANDTDLDGDSLTASVVSSTIHGSLNLSSNGAFTYQPNSNYFGADSFTYRASDGIATSGLAAVTLTITNINYAPVAQNDSFTNFQNTTFSIPFTNLLSNDYDPDGDPITVQFVSTNSTQNGKIVATTTNLTYTPPTNYAGTDTFNYVITDGKGATATGTVFVVLAIPQFAFGAGPIVLNPQTGLYEQNVSVTNSGVSTVAALRLLVSGLRTNVVLYNGAGFDTGLPYVQYNSPLDPGQFVKFALEFYVPDRRPFTNSFIVKVVEPAVSGTNAAAGVPIDRAFVDSRIPGSPRFVIEFVSIPGRVYTVLFTDGAGGWKAATPSITANANRTQWYDDGPPKTDSKPLSIASRFYRVLVAPTN